MAFYFASIGSRQLLRPVINVGTHNPLTTPVGFSAVRGFSRIHNTSHTLPSACVRTVQNANASKSSRLSFIFKGATVAGVGLSLATLNKPTIRCDTRELRPTGPALEDRPPPPASSLSLYELGFGTVAGFCAGVFVKKGAKALAWFLGGIFVLLQYLGSSSVLRMDWGRVAHKFENLFYTKDTSGVARAPNVGSLWNWTTNFLTADFQPRASFIAGFALGLRIG
ncbi:FUN14 family-domain-containing protein [Crassisporium funariophilum]|nr:FUN14 family-domain-containing protein [Crassisporium funariophilum]